MSQADPSKKLTKARQFMALKNYPEALKLYAQLVKQFPRGAGEYGSAAARSGDYDLADRIWETLRNREPNNPELLSRLAFEYQGIRLHSKARALFSEAAKFDARNLDTQLNLASLLARTSSVEEARAAVNRCLELDSRNEQSRYLSAHLARRENQFAEAEKQFRELIASGLRNPVVNYSCHSELANILDRTERFDEAMAQLAEGKILAQKNFKLETERKSFYERHEREVRHAKSLPKNILETWGKSFPPFARNAKASLAFLSGSARSGTTLLERILDAHPSVAACDEPSAFKTIRSQLNVAAPTIPAERLNHLRHRYQKNLTKSLEQSAEGKLLLDKNPSRLVWLPEFLRVFPELRVLIALRDPRDVMISLYFQDQPKTNYLTFEQLAQHYSSVMDVWLAIREWEGLAWLETRYEDTVADMRKEGGRVTQFLGLEWHENQARFFEKNREKTVMSTNYTDVTKPVYTRSVGRWRVYEKQLAPILPMLEFYCRKFDYA